MISMVVHKPTTEQGFSLLMAILVSSIALAIGLSLLSVTLKQLSLSSSVRDSEMSFQLASAGIECAQAIRRSNSNAARDGDPITNQECMGVTRSLTYSSLGSGRHHYETEFPISISGVAGQRCIQYEFFVINDTATNRDVDFTGQDGVRRDFGRTCSAGDVCTVATARGYSENCTNKNNSALYPIQREITAEF